MKIIKRLSMIAVLGVFLISCASSIKNMRTEEVVISGNCDMCKNTIETAGNVKKTAKVSWDKESKIAVLSYDSLKTNTDEILKRIALSGYDNQSFRADDNVYSGLPKCCHYKRAMKEEIIPTPVTTTEIIESEHTTIVASEELQAMQKVFDSYFALKDAFVKSDGNLASAKAKVLLNEIEAVKMSELSEKAHVIFMKTMKDLAFHTKHIRDTKDISHQRDHFDALSDAIFENMKVAKVNEPVYYQFCPMAYDGKGANWVSKEKDIKNPYYGSQMLTCGSTVETVK